MSYEALFSGVGMLSMVAWAGLLLSPWAPVWSDRIATWVAPVLLAIAYVGVSVWLPVEDGGFGSFAEVRVLFTQPAAVMAGWIHFLAFDLLVGAWVCRTGRDAGIPFWAVLPCLPVVFLFGPAGFLLFSGVRHLYGWAPSTAAGSRPA